MTTTTVKTSIVKFGVGGAVLLIVLGLLNWFLIAPNFGVTASQTIGWLGIILSLLCIPLGIRYFRDNINNGSASFGEGFRIGIGISIVTSVIMFFYAMLFFVFQGNEFREWQLKGLEGQQLEAMKAQLAAMPEYAMTPWFQGLVFFLMVFLIGLAMTLLGAFICKKQGGAVSGER